MKGTVLRPCFWTPSGQASALAATQLRATGGRAGGRNVTAVNSRLAHQAGKAGLPSSPHRPHAPLPNLHLLKMTLPSQGELVCASVQPIPARTFQVMLLNCGAQDSLKP